MAGGASSQSGGRRSALIFHIARVVPNNDGKINLIFLNRNIPYLRLGIRPTQATDGQGDRVHARRGVVVG